MSALADALFSQTKQRVLGLLFGQPHRSFGTLELIDLAQSGRGSVQRELAVLASAGLITTETVGLQKRYRANDRSPVFADLRNIVEKTSGVAGVLREALAPIANKIDLALLYGSVAKGTDTSSSDIDVLMVSDAMSMEDTFRALAPAEAKLGRKINPTVYELDEFRSRRMSKQPFLAKLLSGPYVALIGSVDGERSTR